MLCVIGVVYVALHYGAPNANDINDVEEYALTDKVIHSYNRYFCEGLLAKSADVPNNFQSNATLYLLNSQPPLTDLELFNVSRKANLNSDSNNYQSWNFYMNSGSNISLDACYQQGQSISRYNVAFYLIKGSSNHNKWTERPSSSYAVKHSFLSSQCQTISYRVLNSDMYYFVFYLDPDYHSRTVVDIDFSFNRTVYHVSSSTVVQNCSFPLDGQSSCSIGVPISSGYTALLSLNTSLPVDYSDGANVKISCQPRAWLYAVIILSCVLVILIEVSLVVACVCYKIKKGKNSSYSSLTGEESSNTTVQQCHNTLDVVGDADDDDTDSAIALKPASLYNPGYSPAVEGYGTNSALPPYATY